MAKVEKPAPVGRDTYAELGDDNTFDGIQTAPAWATPLPSDKGFPDFSTIRNANDVPVGMFAPDSITNAVKIFILPHLISKAHDYIITALEAYNTIFTNTVAAEFELPAAVVGMKISFIVGSVTVLTIDPTDTDTILTTTPVAGNNVSADAINELIVLECFVAGFWHITYTYGTWTEE
jgi:hypothetical protein